MMRRRKNKNKRFILLLFSFFLALCTSVCAVVCCTMSFCSF
uniref:Uncharacterized protein n=1 Tax=Anguilla anguilla TaxID=7936 RepID=A0A0E9W3D4_ANGAN